MEGSANREMKVVEVRSNKAGFLAGLPAEGERGTEEGESETEEKEREEGERGCKERGR